MSTSSFEGDLLACRTDLRRKAHCLFRNHHDAEDAVQSTMLRAWERRQQFVGGCLGCWLTSILTNVFRDRKRASKWLTFPDDPTYADHLRDTSDPQASLEAKQCLELIATRPDAPILMRAGLGETADELAAQFGLTAANVRQSLHRGRKSLRELFGRDAQTQGA